MFVKMY